MRNENEINKKLIKKEREEARVFLIKIKNKLLVFNITIVKVIVNQKLIKEYYLNYYLHINL